MKTTIISTAATLLASSQLAAAWGDVGHRTVGYLASRYFTPEAHAMTSELLKNDHGWDISDACTWADSVKHRRHYDNAWHWIDAQDSPPNSCGITWPQDCPSSNGCIVSAFANQTGLILNSTTSKTIQKEALMYIIHFVGDIHQPMHTEALYKGGNGIHVCFDNMCGRENLHAIWDTAIVHKQIGLRHREKYNVEKEAARKWADELYEELERKSSTRLEGECVDLSDPTSCMLGWANATNALICDYVIAKGVTWLEENDLGGEYYEGAAPIVKDQIMKGGKRAGAWINALAAAKAAGKGFIIQENMEL